MSPEKLKRWLWALLLYSRMSKCAFFDGNSIKAGIALFELPKDPALTKKWLQVIQRYERTGGAVKIL